jgi:hypothetical protein
MANLVITSTATRVSVDFGAYGAAAGVTLGTWPRSGIQSVQFYGSDYIHMATAGDAPWNVACAANAFGALIVDSVDGVAPASNAALYAQLVALML